MNTSRIASVHPFPARMVPSIVLEELPAKGSDKCIVLDPMAGSGTTLVAARHRGYQAVGFDTDPLAVLIARVWCGNIDPKAIMREAEKTLNKARAQTKLLGTNESFPASADSETREFIEYWFDLRSRRELTALAFNIDQVSRRDVRNVLWCAMSRMVITKSKGVSLGMDISHSRPHRVYMRAPVSALDTFIKSVNHVIKFAPFVRDSPAPAAKILRGDARRLSQPGESVDLVVTSPPYLNAIDYMRGHKLSLVWMGHQINELRSIRSSNIGAHSGGGQEPDPYIDRLVDEMGNVSSLKSNERAMLARYVRDLNLMTGEIFRVLKPGGVATFVMADSRLRGIQLSNSRAVRIIAQDKGLKCIRLRTREIEAKHRYLPAPRNSSSGSRLQSRMLEELIISFQKRKSTEPACLPKS